MFSRKWHILGMVCVFASYSVVGLWASEDVDGPVTKGSEKHPRAVFSSEVDAAAEAISDLENALGQMQMTDKVALLEALGHTENLNAKVLRVLSALSEDDSERVRMRAIMTARRLQLPEWKQWAREALSDSNPRVRARTLSFLGLSCSYDFVEEMLNELENPDEGVKAAAAGALGNITEQLATELNSVFVDVGNGFDIRVSAAAPLARLQNTCAAAYGFLREIMDDREYQQVQAQTASYLLLLAGDAQALSYFLHNYDPENSAHFVMGLALESIATRFFDLTQLVPYVHGDTLSVDAIRRWAEDNEWRILWDKDTRKFVSASESQGDT